MEVNGTVMLPPLVFPGTSPPFHRNPGYNFKKMEQVLAEPERAEKKFEDGSEEGEMGLVACTINVLQS
jgi:hypothetical protein